MDYINFILLVYLTIISTKSYILHRKNSTEISVLYSKLYAKIETDKLNKYKNEDGLFRVK